jgi:hypothetical protein
MVIPRGSVIVAGATYTAEFRYECLAAHCLAVQQATQTTGAMEPRSPDPAAPESDHHDQVAVTCAKVVPVVQGDPRTPKIKTAVCGPDAAAP